MRVANLPSSSSQGTSHVQSQGGKFQKVLLEYTAVNNLKVLGSSGVEFKEWGEQLVNVLGQFKSGSRDVITWIKERKDKKIEKSDYAS